MSYLFEQLKFVRYDEELKLHAIQSYWRTHITVYKIYYDGDGDDKYLEQPIETTIRTEFRYSVEIINNNSKTNYPNCTPDVVDDILRSEEKKAQTELNKEFANEKFEDIFGVFRGDNDYDSSGYTHIGHYAIDVFPEINNLFTVKVFSDEWSNHTYHGRLRHEVVQILIELKEKYKEDLDFERKIENQGNLHQMSKDGWNESYPDGYRSDDDGDSMYPGGPHQP